MAVLPDMIHNNANISSLAVGGVAGGVAFMVFEQEPLTAGLIGLGAAAVTRGLIHLDSDDEMETISAKGINVAISRRKDGTATLSGVVSGKSEDIDNLAVALNAAAAHARKKKAA
jgi:hypothetical protein